MTTLTKFVTLWKWKSSAAVGIAVIQIILPQQFRVLALIFNAINLLSIIYFLFLLLTCLQY